MATTAPGGGEIGQLEELDQIIFVVLIPLITGFLRLFTAGYFAWYRVIQKPKGNDEMVKIANAIKEGAKAFLKSEYLYICIYLIIMLILVGVVTTPDDVLKTLLSFVIGAVLSGVCGYIGMVIAVEANVRTANALVVVFGSGGVMGITGKYNFIRFSNDLCNMGWFRSKRDTLLSRIWFWCLVHCIICTCWWCRFSWKSKSKCP